MEQLNKDLIISFLREHRTELKEKFGVTKIALFGSYARGEQHEQSDVDILIEMKEKSFRNRFFLKEFLEQHFHRKVDVGYFGSLKTFVMRSIEEDLVYV